MKKNRIISLILAVLVVCSFCVFAVGSGESETTDQGKAGTIETSESSKANLGDYGIEIKSCRLAEDYEGKPVAIITYGFTNNADESASFTFAFDDQVYQNGVGLNKSYVLDDSANYDDANQSKEIKKGAVLDVDVAYELNDTTTDLEVEVKEWISFNDSVVKKTFTITE